MLDTNDILDTIRMISDENLDVRTVTMGISLLDCADADGRRACEKIYNKITSRAKNLVRTAERISATYGMPIVNKRVSVTPIAMLLASAPDADPVWYARALDAAAKTVGVNFIGGDSALVHKGFSAGDERLIRSIPDALAQTEFVCSSVNVGSTKSGINMDAVKMMGPIIKAAAEKTKDNWCMWASRARAPCARRWQSCRGMPAWIKWPSSSSARPSKLRAWASWWATLPARRWACPLALWTFRWPPRLPWAIPWPIFWKRLAWKAAAAAAPQPRWPC